MDIYLLSFLQDIQDTPGKTQWNRLYNEYPKTEATLAKVIALKEDGYLSYTMTGDELQWRISPKGRQLLRENNLLHLFR